VVRDPEATPLECTGVALLFRCAPRERGVFSHPDEYDGGELIVENTYRPHSVKLPAGHMILYPATSLHRVRPVTGGTRLCSFFWLQSMTRDNGKPTVLFDLGIAIQTLNNDLPEHSSAVQCTGVYHNLLRHWPSCSLAASDLPNDPCRTRAAARSRRLARRTGIGEERSVI
jgi:hypothetical protein